MKYALVTLLLLLGLTTVINSNAYAHGRVFIGGGIIAGPAYYPYPPYYGYPYYAYPPAYPPAYAPAYGQPQPYEPPPPTAYDQYYRDQQGEYCREYVRHIVVEGRKQKAYGHACRQPDGSWHIID